ncbi:unnamed protein product [Enterobius vermicularis]|uniref:Valine--tRNA ligase n=1 Tax=Enterobius vermicularis TaxID=51028 RepID=A0A0N4V747_ENTVE|nr:unnamed protein product [Enterobius vermicularis]
MAVEEAANEVKKKTAVQLKKEAAKAEKLAKFREKEKRMAEKKLQMANKAGEKEIRKPKKDVIEYTFNTPKGAKKDVSHEMPNAYSPRYVEAAWYEWWENEGFFKPEYGGRDISKPNEKGHFTVVIPPPNVTGTLHLGHALATSVEDVICRWHRMKGETVLFNPGCDHAGIATQVVVEKRLKKEKGLSRHDLGREKFVEEVWKWKNEKGMAIYDQIRKMGAGVDWDRACFMMDPKIMRAVAHAFIMMHDNGVIYRSNRLVNWSCTLRSAISDIEVDKIELTGRTLLSVPGYKNKVEFGVLVSFAYPVEDSDEEVVVATTRVETMLGDTAIAVHPDDDRYQHLIGKYCKHPFLDRRLLIVADSFVEKEFGTGAVKITPAHDHNDYEVGLRHNLPFITIFTDDGIMNDKCGQFKGLKRFEAREAVLEALKKAGYYRSTKDNAMIVPICSRSKDIIEPIMKAQWYVKCNVMAERAKKAVESGDLKIIPDFHVATWYRWLQGSRDWCISRQLWWGHRIPAYFVTVDDPSIPPGDSDNDDYWVSAHDEEEAISKAAAKFKVSKEKVTVKWDEDVLDTWFSSGMWPFTIFGWPEKTTDLDAFFPGSVLETGHDILFFWVARMVFMSQELTGKLPFKEVYLHAMIRDAHGRKMSKSLGNVIDPLDVIHGISLEGLNRQLEVGNLDPRELKIAKEGQARDYPNGIPECGTDALRFALLAYTSHGRDINLDVLRIQGYRFFCNKIWQATRFTLMQLGSTFVPEPYFKLSNEESILDQWILSRLAAAVEASNYGMANYAFQLATTAIFNFWLYDLCDIYLEGSKPVFSQGDSSLVENTRNILYLCVDVGLRLLAPFMPFITEELWQRLPRRAFDNAPSICVASYPEAVEFAGYRNEALESRIAEAMAIVKTVRSLRSDYDLPPKVKIDLFVSFTEKQDADAIKGLTPLIATLASSQKVTIIDSSQLSEIPHGCARVTVSAKCGVSLALEGIIDLEKEIAKLGEKQSKLNAQLAKLGEVMAKPDYESKVPLGVRTNNSEKRDMLLAELAHIEDALEALKASA